MTPAEAAAPRYDGFTIVLHWTTAALVVLLWLGAQIIDVFPSGAPRIGARSFHIGLGVMLAGVLVIRLLWRLTFGRGLVPGDPGLLGLVAKWTHWLLYVLLAVVVLGGLLNVWVRGDSFFGLFTVPALSSGDRWLRRLVGGVHELAANAILLVAGLHTLAALVHHFILRDTTLQRMLRSPRG